MGQQARAGPATLDGAARRSRVRCGRSTCTPVSGARGGSREAGRHIFELFGDVFAKLLHRSATCRTGSPIPASESGSRVADAPGVVCVAPVQVRYAASSESRWERRLRRLPALPAATRVARSGDPVSQAAAELHAAKLRDQQLRCSISALAVAFAALCDSTTSSRCPMRASRSSSKALSASMSSG